jgi:glucokinase
MNRDLSSESTILAGDVGGTKILLGLFARAAGGQLRLIRDRRFRTAEASRLEDAIDQFVAEDEGGRAPVTAAAFGVAGPVRDGVADSTNIPWDVDARALAAHLGLPRAGVINDLVAMGHGIRAIGPDRFVALDEGRPDPSGNGALLAAGTGLGQAILLDDGDGWTPVPSEGGHAGFAPETPLEDELVGWLRGRFAAEPSHGHVSRERVLSGPGLYNIYRFLRDTGRGEEFDWMTSRLQAEDPPRVIVELGLAGQSPLCSAAVELFAEIYGSIAGDLALACLATGGVFLGGGIAPAILPLLRGPAFQRGYLAKGRMRGLVSAIPVKVILEPLAPLFGAAFHACRISSV